MTSKTLDVASDAAFQRLEAAGGDPSRLPVALATVIIIYSAQGVIDNGGFRYFFESDFPGTPPYAMFIDAYRRIGAVEAADALSRAVAQFPFEDAHLHVQKRNEFMDRLAETSDIFSLGDAVCGDRRVWDRLEQYVAEHAEAFR